MLFKVKEILTSLGFEEIRKGLYLNKYMNKEFLFDDNTTVKMIPSLIHSNGYMHGAKDSRQFHKRMSKR